MTPRAVFACGLLIAFIGQTGLSSAQHRISGSAAAGPGSAVATATVAPAESAFADGRFDAADSAFAAVLTATPRDTLALLRRGQIALMSNRLDAARGLLERARDAGASSQRVSALLAEVAYRRDDFAAAAGLFRLAGREAHAKKLESFGTKPPWQIIGPDTARIHMVQVDPLPLVKASVDGRGPYYFLIDTGGGELVLDPTLADSIGAPRFGEEMGTFGGGKQRAVVLSRLDRFDLGPITIRDLPIGLLDTKRFSAAAMGRRVVGVIGTVLLDHFRATLDYPSGQLVLVRRESRGGQSQAAGIAGRIEVPFWMAGDHLILARGSLDSSRTLTWFVDTGLAGAAFTAPAATLQLAGIALPDTARGLTGQGGGGAVRFAMFDVHQLSLGDARASDLVGIFGAFPTTLGQKQGIRVDGIVSHAFLRTWRVTFDFDRMRIVLDPAG